MPSYSCRSMPTIQEFMDSNAFIRGLMGPLGCLPGDTEFMTPFGWRRIDAYLPGSLVLQWAPDGTTSWIVPDGYINEPAGKFFLFESGHLKMALSPEHRVPHTNYLGRFCVSTAADIVGSCTRREIPTTFLAPDGPGLLPAMSDDMIRFAVMMHADGHYVPQGKQAVVTVRKERKKARIRQILAALDIAFDERTYDGRPTETNFVFYPPYRGKRFGPEWYAATQAQMLVVLDEIQHWDGLFGSPEKRYFSNHKADADFIQYAAHANGRRAVIRHRVYEQDGWQPKYCVFIRAGDSHKNRASIREHTSIKLLEAADGRKYCFTVPSGFFVARYRDTVFVTGNSGKSSACVMEVVQRGLAQKPGPDGVRRSRWGVLRNTAKQLEDTTERTFLQWFPPITFGQWTPSKHNFMMNTLRGEGDTKAAEIEIMFRALDRPDQIGDLLSLELTGAWINEAREIPWAIVDALRPRVGRYPAMRDGGASWHGIIMDTNPPDVESEWFKFFEMADHTETVAELAKIPEYSGLTVDSFRRLFRQPSGRSPRAENLPNLRPGYYQSEAIGKSDEWCRVYIDGDYGFVTDGKPVFPEYNDTLHCPTDPDKAPRPQRALPIMRSYDFGLTPACIYSQLTARGQWIVFDELVSSSMGVDQFSDEVIEHSARHYPHFEFQDVGDPAGAQKAQTDERTCFGIMHAKGIMVEPGLQTLAIRLESVRKPLRTLVDGRPQFVLHTRCTQLRRALMGGYHYRRMRITGERYTEQPEKNMYSHPADALGYAGTRLFGAGLYLARETSSNDRVSNDQSRSRTTGY